jgi:hypothetical protein
VGNTNNHGFVAVDRVKVQAKLTTSLSEWVLSDSVPESVLGIGWAGPDLTGDEVNFVDVLGYQMVDHVPELSRETG